MDSATHTIDLGDALSKTAAAVENNLQEILSADPEPGEITRPGRLLDAMRHAVFAGGKRFRPFLIVETARLFNTGGNGPVLAGCAVEVLHTYSLIHDDLPAMDDDDMRRGQPTVHKAFDEATAILAGDALQALAFDILARPAVHPDPAVRAELVAILASAVGVGGMAGGQMLDLAAEAGNLEENAIRQMQAMKTGALITACCQMGAALGGASAADRKDLTDYGQRLGLAFQIADDLLDIEGDAEALGKATAKDEARGKATLASCLGREHARVVLAETVRDCERALERFGEKASILIQAARFSANRSN